MAGAEGAAGVSEKPPPYVEYGSLATAPGPLRCTGARLWGFWVEGERGRIEALCSKVFSTPSGGAVVVRPLLDHVVLTFGEIERIVAGHDYGGRGNVTERQVGIWVPVLLLRRRGRVLLPSILGAFIPYMWLDNPLSVASGREVYGYPKSWGWATFPGERPRGLCGGEPSESFTLDVYGLRTHRPDTKADRERLLEVKPAGAGATARFEPIAYDSLGAMLMAHAAELGAELDPAELAAAPSEREALLASLRLPSPTVNQVFLKQFRAAGDGRLASQQQIVRARAKPTRTGEARSIAPHELEISELDSHPLGRELGLGPTPPVRLPFTVEMDFTVDEGEVVWDSAG